MNEFSLAVGLYYLSPFKIQMLPAILLGVMVLHSASMCPLKLSSEKFLIDYNITV